MKLIKKLRITNYELTQNKALLPQALSRRVPTVYQLAYLATKLCLENQENAESIICKSSLGCLDETISFIDKFEATNLGSPKDFVFSTHNSVGGMLAKEFGVKGANFTICEREFEKVLSICQILEEKTILVVEFEDGNEFAQKASANCETKTAKEAFATAYLYSKD